MAQNNHPSKNLLITVKGVAGSTGVFVTEPNPHGRDLIILDSVLNIKTASTGASTLDIGLNASPTTSNDTIIDGLSGATAGVLSTRGSNGLQKLRWPAASNLNIAEASGDVAGLDAVLLVTYTYAE